MNVKIVDIRMQIGHLLNMLDVLSVELGNAERDADQRDTDKMISKIEEGLDYYDGLMGRSNL